jgi:hypothetical protein
VQCGAVQWGAGEDMQMETETEMEI